MPPELPFIFRGTELGPNFPKFNSKSNLKTTFCHLDAVFCFAALNSVSSKMITGSEKKLKSLILYTFY